MRAFDNNLFEYLPAARLNGAMVNIGSIHDNWTDAANELVRMGHAEWLSEDILAINGGAEILCRPKELMTSEESTDGSPTSKSQESITQE